MSMGVMNDALLRALSDRVKNLGVQPVRPQDEIQIDFFMNESLGFEAGKGGRACPNVPNTAYYMAAGKGSFNNWYNYFAKDTKENDKLSHFKKVADNARYQGIQLHHETGIATKVVTKGMKFPVAPHGELQLLDTCKREVPNKGFVIILDPRHFPTQASYMELVSPAFFNNDFLPALTIAVNNNETARGYVKKVVDHYAKNPDSSYAGNWGTVLTSKSLIIATAITKRRLYLRLARKAAYLGRDESVVNQDFTDEGFPEVHDDREKWVKVRDLRDALLGKTATKYQKTFMGVDSSIPIPDRNVDDYKDLIEEDPILQSYEQFYENSMGTLSNVPRFEASSGTVTNGVFSGIGLAF